MTIPDLYALLERLAANADEQKRYRDAAEIRDGMKALGPVVRWINQEGGTDYMRIIPRVGVVWEDRDTHEAWCVANVPGYIGIGRA